MAAWVISISIVLLIYSLYSVTSKYKKLTNQYTKVLYQLKDLEKKDFMHNQIMNLTMCEIQGAINEIVDMRRNDDYPDQRIHDLIYKLDKIETSVNDRW